ncbi:MAG TPA: hypothetical protein VNU64_23185 [Burkholderiales bacterium]|nr:hypothetical protein [Burkholderiales bacterium]
MAREPAAAAAIAILLLSACAAAQTEVPARIDHPTTESRAALAKAVSAALNAPVTLADDALTRDSVLIVEKRRTDRDLGRPERFQLVKAGRDCILVHEGTGKRTPLASTTCVPVVP